MEYCPFCANPLPRKVSLCPHCNKNLEISYLKELYLTEDSSHIDTRSLRKIWFREHRHIILSVLFLLLGILLGAAGIYSYAQLQFRQEKQNLQSQISDLQQQIKDLQSASQNQQQTVEAELKKRDEIITLLTEQKKLMGQIMAFTRRLANNSTITPNDPAQGNYFLRNWRYLVQQYNKKQEKLKEMQADQGIDPNLTTIPQFSE